MPAARERGYGPGRFSFNVAGGRCEACQGDGVIKVEMHFLPDVYVPCDVCHGQRYNRETLEVLYKGKQHHRGARPDGRGRARLLQRRAERSRASCRRCSTSASATSGSARARPRCRAARRSASSWRSSCRKRDTGRTLYILDEPTTGLHFADIDLLLKVLHQLRDAGNTIVVIEHNLDVIKTADWVIDMGPEGGAGGGQVVAAGTPEDVAANRGELHRPLSARRCWPPDPAERSAPRGRTRLDSRSPNGERAMTDADRLLLLAAIALDLPRPRALRRDRARPPGRRSTSCRSISAAVFPVSGGLPLAKRAPQRQAYRLVELKRFSRAPRACRSTCIRATFRSASDDAAKLIIAVDSHDGSDAAMALRGGGAARRLGRGAQHRRPERCWPAMLDEPACRRARLDDAQSQAVHERYEQDTQRAIEAGVFGAPTYVDRRRDVLGPGPARLRRAPPGPGGLNAPAARGTQKKPVQRHRLFSAA